MISRELNHIPVIKKGKIVDLYTISKKEKKKIKNFFVIMAGGFGKRLHPVTKKIPKPMIKINKKPILEHIILRAKNYIKEKNEEDIKIINEKILDDDLKNLEGINNKMLALLAVNDIKTLDDFAGLATFDLIDKEEGIFKELDIEEKIVNNMIMKAREKWFKEDQ